MADVKLAYSAADSPTAITVTLTSLADGSSRESTAVTNTSTLYLDALVRAKINGTASSTSVVYVYAYGSLETTTAIYTDAATGSDAAFTTANIKNSKLIGIITCNGATSVTGGPMSVASAFGGHLPNKWGLIFRNESGAALSATGGDFDVDFVGIYATVA